MANVKVRVLNAVVDGKTAGSLLEIDEKSAQHLASIKYVEIIEEPKPQPKAQAVEGEKGKSAPKKPTTTRRKKADK